MYNADSIHWMELQVAFLNFEKEEGGEKENARFRSHQRH